MSGANEVVVRARWNPYRIRSLPQWLLACAVVICAAVLCAGLLGCRGRHVKDGQAKQDRHCHGTAPTDDRPAFLRKPSADHLRIVSYNINWDAIFPLNDPQSHKWRSSYKRAEFDRVVRALKPDVLCLQEINPDRDAQQVADMLDEILPLPGGQRWHAMIGADNVILSRYPLSMQATETVPPTGRGHAMALIDLPDKHWPHDLYLIDAHFKSAGGEQNIHLRQIHADAVVSWLRDAETPGGKINLPKCTPLVALGDLNVYDTDPHYHLTTLITGDIVNESKFGSDFAPDWDGSAMTDAKPLHNGVGPESWTWREDDSQFAPFPLDHIVYTDSVLRVDNCFSLNTAKMSAQDLKKSGLQKFDVALDGPAGKFDHIPLVVDVAPLENCPPRH